MQSKQLQITDVRLKILLTDESRGNLSRLNKAHYDGYKSKALVEMDYQ